MGSENSHFDEHINLTLPYRVTNEGAGQRRHGMREDFADIATRVQGETLVRFGVGDPDPSHAQVLPICRWIARLPVDQSIERHTNYGNEVPVRFA